MVLEAEESADSVNRFGRARDCSRFVTFTALNGRDAHYVVVGAQAVTCGAIRGTRDIDILIEATEDHAKHVIDALADLGFFWCVIVIRT